MANILDYLGWRGDLSFSQSPFHAVDSLLLCCLSYIHFDEIVPAPGRGEIALPEAASRFLSKEAGRRTVRAPDDELVLQKAALSRRFRTVRLAAYVSDFDSARQKQFCAVTFLLPDDTACLVYRGTDDTLVGWKEDFNMSFLSVVPAQQDALTYFTTVAHAYPARLLRTAGHSKGGNLAIFAAARCGLLQGRILGIYNNDGPGFQREMLQSAGYHAIQNRIHTFVPQSSLIGMLLEHTERYQVVHSNQKGILQHDPYSWEVFGNDFVTEPAITPSQQQCNRAIRDWIASVPPAQREAFVEELFRLLSAAASDENAAPPNSAGEWLQVLRTFYTSEPAQRSVIQETLNKLFEAARDVILGRRTESEATALPKANTPEAKP
ncbi:MAG: DUF2974 domain-containing protein [Faecalibacterium sp.]|jgi:hypothetical protein|nr:DUF2974 domain-containing protein [Faecalibacterium sp.]